MLVFEAFALTKTSRREEGGGGHYTEWLLYIKLECPQQEEDEDEEVEKNKYQFAW